ncbi:MAG TPA: RDD family protein [Vicinamibacterales bacterium]|nr:RDD family protein [Vicinamibacterales bacterium]
MPFEERLKIDTPEQITLELPIAGIGSRFVAVAVDTVLQALTLATGMFALTLGARWTFGVLKLAGPAAAILFAFCVYWGYFAGFEIAWSGQTPGKRMAGVRVIHESGRPVSAFEAIARNVLRAIDFLPLLYGVGIITMLLNRQSRRIGDYVAGTVVVYDSSAAQPRLDWHDIDSAAVPSARLTQVSTEELSLIETYLRRRLDLDPLVREEMADQIVHRLTQKTGITRDAGQSAESLLEAVARRVRDSARFR